jgi:hypothetical protein
LTFADGSPTPASCAPPPAYFSPPVGAPAAAAAPTWPPFFPQALLFADFGGPTRAAQQFHIPSLSGPAYGGGPIAYPGAGFYPGIPAAPAAPAAAPAARPPAVAVKPEPGSAPGKEKAGQEKKKFLSQPLHVYVSGSDASTVPSGLCMRPPCSCAHRLSAMGIQPGLHATWDCPLRYVEQCGFCPGFHNDGSRDPAQWMPCGEVLRVTRAAKDAWIKLIDRHKLPLPNEAGARAPDFRK